MKDIVRVAVYHRGFLLTGHKWQDLNPNLCTELLRIHLFAGQKIQHTELLRAQDQHHRVAPGRKKCIADPRRFVEVEKDSVRGPQINLLGEIECLHILSGGPLEFRKQRKGALPAQAEGFEMLPAIPLPMNVDKMPV